MSREAFEAWVSDNDDHPRACMKDPDGRYAFPSVRNAYFIWQAATDAALEEAEYLCRQMFNRAATADECADAIRALKEKE